MIELEPFQREFETGALADGIRTAVLSGPRGLGKSSFAAYLVCRILDPQDPLFRPGTESVLISGSLEQGRIINRLAREDLEKKGIYRFRDSTVGVGVSHPASNTAVSVRASNGKTLFGLIRCPYVLCDEPGAWEVNSGRTVFDAIQSSMGKPGSPLRALYFGTMAPSLSGWWVDMVNKGTHGSTYVMSFSGSKETWDKWATIKKCNPLTRISPDFRKVLLEERDAAKHDNRLKSRFLSYRLNIPTGDSSQMLLTVEDWANVTARPVGARDGVPIVGLDLGGGRSWHSAIALYPSGRVEALAVAPGIPSIQDQERRDVVPRGTYQKLVDGGKLLVATGLRVQPASQLMDAVRAEWGKVAGIVCDRFRINELQDCVNGTPVSPRVTRWSEASNDIRDLRKLALDGPLSCPVDSRPLLEASLSVSVVKCDDQGNTRLTKGDSNGKARDDVSAALTMAAGAFERSNQGKKNGGAYLGMT